MARNEWLGDEARTDTADIAEREPRTDVAVDDLRVDLHTAAPPAEVRSPDPAPAEGGSAPVPTRELQPAPETTQRLSRWAGLGFLLVGAGALLVGLLLAATSWEPLDLTADRVWPVAFAALVMGVALGVLHWLDAAPRGKGYGVFRPLIGADLRYSTSLTQMGAWTVVVGTGFAYLLGRVMFEGERFRAVIDADRWEEYLILLGGPFAATVLAKGIVTYKVERGTLQKAETDATAPAQVLQGDGGQTDLIDAQYLVFNVIAMGYFVVRMVLTGELPELPAPLLAVTGATATAYVANKAAQRNAPMITAITPRSAGAGTVVTVFGANFDPIGPPPDVAGAKQQSDALESYGNRRITVSLDGHTATIDPTLSRNDLVRFVVPKAAAAGDQLLRITSTAGVETAPHELTILPSTPRLVAVDAPDAALVAGRPAQLIGEDLGADGTVVQVLVGQIPTVGRITGDRLGFTVPAGARPDTDGLVEVQVSDRSGRTASLTVPLRVPEPPS